MKNFSSAEQKKLRDNAKEELERLEKIIDDEKTVQLLDSFKNKYNLCESVYKVVLKEHQKVLHNSSNSYLKVAMTQVPYALNFAGYSFDRNFLTELFGSSSTKGRTVKKLRDAITHGIDKSATEEIKQRKEELFGYMDDFLNTIKTFDNAA